MIPMRALAARVTGPMGSQLGGQLTDWGYHAGWTLSRRLPESVVATAFDQIGNVASWRGGGSVDQLRRNLGRARPDLDDGALDQLVHEAMRSYMRYWREAFRLPEWSLGEIEDRIRTVHEERLFDGLDAGHGVIAVLGHFGNWDHAGAWAAARGVTLTTVAERLKPESLFDQFLAYRESLGMEVLPLTGGPDVTDLLQQRLREGGLVALLADRDLTTTGIEVELLGESAHMPAGPALLAERTGAVLLPTISWYEDDRTVLAFREPLRPASASQGSRLRERVHDLTQQWADIVGDAAREHARDWHMLQPMWDADR